MPPMKLTVAPGELRTRLALVNFDVAPALEPPGNRSDGRLPAGEVIAPTVSLDATLAMLLYARN